MEDYIVGGAESIGGAPSREQKSRLRLVCWSGPGPSAQRDGEKDALQRYARRYAGLISARLLEVPDLAERRETGAGDHAVRLDCDLLLVDDIPQADLMRSTSGKSLPSLLIVRQLVWPIRRILMLMRGEATDRATVEWGLRLAYSAGSRVTLFVVLPPSKSRQDCRESKLADVLARHTVTGSYVRQVLQRLVSLNIDAVLRLRQGALSGQVRQELESTNYDLVITSAEPPGRLLSGHLERLIVPLLQWTPAPVLVARLPEKPSEQALEEEST